MPQSHHVIALISGGKDSFLSLLHCIKLHHQVVALVNLDSDVDLDSHMYQTVGHELVPLYSTALHVPLYRGVISGSAIIKTKDYYLAPQSFVGNEISAPDETESLLPLLRRILVAHPDATALSSGAILSTYQRSRIESVALRLGLVPLAYLWQYPLLPSPVPSPSGLLQEIAAVGLEARIVKVASGGLDEGFLWEDLRDERVRRRLESKMSRFGGSVLGEGGEYETLVLSGPNELFRGRIEVEKEERWVEKGKGGEAWLEFRGGRVVDEKKGDRGQGWRTKLIIPDLWDEEFKQLPRKIRDEVGAFHSISQNRSHGSLRAREWTAKPIVLKMVSTFVVLNLTASSTEGRASSPMSTIRASLLAVLATHSLSPSSITFTTILLRSMSDFASINSVYATLFSAPNPPARVTVACGDLLPKGVEVMASFVVDVNERVEREGLHVQSRSYWAPANIGPYSQAIRLSVGKPGTEAEERGQERGKIELVYIAGQIPLVPSTMEILGEGKDARDANFAGDGLELFCQQACLALQHLWRIGTSTGVGWWVGGIAFIVGKRDVEEKARATWLLWKTVHGRDFGRTADDEEDTVDVWDRKYGGMGSLAPKERATRLPDFQNVSADPTGSLMGYVPSFFAVQVSELPKGCEVEWQALGVSGGKVKIGSLVVDDLSVSRCCLPACGLMVHSFGILKSSLDQFPDMDIQGIIHKIIKNTFDGVEYDTQTPATQVTIYTPHLDLMEDVTAQLIPCKSVWGPAGGELAAGVVLYSETQNGSWISNE